MVCDHPVTPTQAAGYAMGTGCACAKLGLHSKVTSFMAWIQDRDQPSYAHTGSGFAMGRKLCLCRTRITLNSNESDGVICLFIYLYFIYLFILFIYLFFFYFLWSVITQCSGLCHGNRLCLCETRITLKSNEFVAWIPDRDQPSVAGLPWGTGCICARLELHSTVTCL